MSDAVHVTEDTKMSRPSGHKYCLKGAVKSRAHHKHHILT